MFHEQHTATHGRDYAANEYNEHGGNSSIGLDHALSNTKCGCKSANMQQMIFEGAPLGWSD
jgi:hypothetical protein